MDERPPRPSGPRIRTRPKHSLDFADAAVQAPAPAPFVPPPPLPAPPALDFAPPPIPWKGLPLEVAQWTFSSAELQEIVSRAIRLSARESFVRLLSLQALEVDIVHEHERLQAERAAAQARWRFEAGRRTMLLQALNAAASAPDPAPDALPAFVPQLAASIAASDALLASVLSLADQQAQIELIQHQHWASALAIALRKLSRAHERQAHDLAAALARAQTLEDELEEAWREAEKMAIEFDDLEHDLGPDDDLVRPPIDDIPTPTDSLPPNTDIAVVLGVTATAVASKATLVSSSGSPRVPDKADAKSLRSIRSRRSARDSHVARLSAARLRSRTASNASLRLPKSLRSPSSSSVPIVVVDHDTPPPMPALPPHSITGRSFLDMEQVSPQEPARKMPPKRHPEPTAALPTPPHSAGLPHTHVPSVWLDPDETDDDARGRLDRTHSMQIFSSHAPPRARRSNLVMSLTSSDRAPDSGPASPSPEPSRSTSARASLSGFPPPRMAMELGRETIRAHRTGPGSGEGYVVPASPTSEHSLMSLTAHVQASSNTAFGGVYVGPTPHRPGSAGARLTTTIAPSTSASSPTTTRNARTPTPTTPKRSLMSRASSVILRRLSQATTTMGQHRASPANGRRARTGMAKGAGKGSTSGIGKGSGGLSPSPTSSRSRSHEALRLSGSGSGSGSGTGSGFGRERRRGKGGSDGDLEGDGCGEDDGGEVMVIGSLRSASTSLDLDEV